MPSITKSPLWVLISFVTVILTGVFFLLAYLADTIPNDKVRNNIVASEEFLIDDTYLALPNILFVKDLNSDAIMVGSQGLEDSIGVLHKTLTNPTVLPSPESDYEWEHLRPHNYYDYYTNVDGAVIAPYARYWHGYKVTLKPLLMFMPYSKIRLLNHSLLFFLALTCIYLINKRINWQTGFLFATSLIITGFSYVPDILIYSTSFYIMFCFIIALLTTKSNRWSDKKILIAFYCVGAVTSYMELLATPIITLGYPLAILYLYKSQTQFTHRIKFLIRCIIFWGAGYLILWCAKWVLTDILCGDVNVIRDAISQIGIWTNSPTFEGGFEFWPFCYLFLAILFLWLCATVVRLRMGNTKKLAIELWPLVLIAALPLLWVCVAKSHSYYHFKFVWRIFGITVFALSVVWWQIFNSHKRVEGQNSALQTE